MRPAKLTKRQQLEATAYHEAGHAVVMILLEHPVASVTIIGRPNARPARPEAIDPEQDIMIAQAGPECLEVFDIPSDESGCGAADGVKIQNILDNRYGTDDTFAAEKDQTQRRLLSKTEAVLKRLKVKAAIQALALALLEQKTIAGCDVHAIVKPILAG